MLARIFNIPILIFKDADTFEHYTLIFTAVSKTTSFGTIACLHHDGERYSGLDPSAEGLERLREIYESQLRIMEENAEEHQVIELQRMIYECTHIISLISDFASIA